MIGSLVAALVLSSSCLLDAAAAEFQIVAFDEPGFPALGIATPAAIPADAIVAHDGAELDSKLATADLLIWRHGSAFPAESWSAILRFLERGGSLAHLGGEPFTQPLVGDVGQRAIVGRTLDPLYALRLLRPTELAANDSTLGFVGPLAALPSVPLTTASRVTVLEPRFCDSREVADEEGSPGPRDAILRPLAYLSRERDVPHEPFAAAAYSIDRIRGRFAGGRWVLWLLDRAPETPVVERLIAIARETPIEVLAQPALAAIHDDERPRIRIRITEPRPSAEPRTIQLRVSLEGKKDVATHEFALAPGTFDTTLELDRVTSPGLYRITIDGLPGGTVTTGFVKTTPDLLAEGPSLAVDGSNLTRGRRPIRGIGTTMMSPDVHRAFLFEPNPALWDDEFARAAAFDFDLVRTGLWYGWSLLLDESGAVDEAFLRALEAYYTCAQRHDIALIFNVFAFLPPQFVATHPYLDLAAVEKQQRIVSAIASRFARSGSFVIDFINEPSFAPPKLTWYARPSGESVDKDAFLRWLESTYGGSAIDWRQIVAARWNLAPGAAIDLPSLRDFEEAQVFADRRPLRALDYLRFTQSAFEDWTKTLAAAVRATGSRALLTVGQDEGGLLERPNPLFHARSVSFTSMHTWWWNDALLFDSLGSKARGVPFLLSETGIQPRERRDGNSQRDGLTAARLLSRKLAAAFAGRACGTIQWCLHTNPYLASDAEAGIGLMRVDGSATPELAVMARFARFLKRNAEAFGTLDEPALDFVLPNSDLAGPRALPKDGASRAVERLTFGLAMNVQTVHEWRPETLAADFIVLPAARTYDSRLIAAVRDRVTKGATVVASGIVRRDDGSLAFPELANGTRALGRRETLTIGSHEFSLEFPLAAYESLDAARGNGVTRTRVGRGEIVHVPLPLEYALDGGTAIEAFYADALAGSPHAPPQLGIPPQSPVHVAYVPYQGGKRVLVAAINETGVDRTVRISLSAHPENAVDVEIKAGRGHLVLLAADGKVIDALED